MLKVLVVLIAVVALTALPASAADDEYVCGDPDVATLAIVDCTGTDATAFDPYYEQEPQTIESLQALAAASEAAMPSPAELPAYCRVHANAYFYTSDLAWTRLAERLRENASPCVDYWIAITALANDKTAPRCLQDDIIRALGPRFHVMAELHFGGWQSWWNKNGKTPAEAGREFVGKWRACGYLQPGETWALNEIPAAIRQNLPSARANFIQLVDAVREASGVRGVVWISGLGQLTQNLGVYKPNMQAWLQDAGFWTAMQNDVDVWGQEAYPDMRYWGVSDASRHARTDNVNVYLEHPLLLAENGPPETQTARDFLRATYVPLGSAAWQYKSGFGNTLFPAEQMQRFVSEQVFAVKHFSLTRPQSAPDGRIAFAWAPTNNCGTQANPVPCIDPKLYTQGVDDILARLSLAIREAYEHGGGSQMGACGEPGDYSWCKDVDVTGATFNPAWQTFPDW
jgi:ABC-type cobalt transport system substrate-binding protein